MRLATFALAPGRPFSITKMRARMLCHAPCLPADEFSGDGA